MTRKERKERQRQAAQDKKDGVIPQPVVSKRKKKEVKRDNRLDPGQGFWKRNLIPALILLALPFVLYASTLKFGYVLDDQIVLYENDFVTTKIVNQEDGGDWYNPNTWNMSGVWDILSEETFTGYLGEQKDLVEGGRYRPLSLVSFAIEYSIFGDNAGLFHLFNIIWYALLGLLIFRILSMLFPSKDKRWYFAIPFIASILYMAHPIHTEAVANIKGRDEIMTFTLALLALYLSLRYVLQPKVFYLVASGLIFLLALLAKENAITFLAIIPMTIWTFSSVSIGQNVKVVIPLLLATIAYLAIRFQVIGYLLDSGKEITKLLNDPFIEMTGGEKYATIFYTLWRYIQLLFYPHPLTHDYYPYHIPKIGWADLRAIGPLFLYMGMTGYAVFKLWTKKAFPAYAILFFVITLSITSNMVVGVGTFMNERFAFMPSLGFTMLVAYWLVNYLPRKGNNWKSIRMASMILAGLLLAGYTYKTLDRVPDWKDGWTLNLSASKVSKNSARMNNFMGYEYYKMANATSDRELKRQYLDQATPYMDHALEIYPTYSDALNGKAGILAGYYGLDRDLTTLLNGFYQLLAVRNSTYIDSYLEYLNKRGANPELTNFYHHTGYTLFIENQRDLQRAAKYLNYGIQLDPNSAILNQDICILKYLQGRNQEAINYGRRALSLDPTLTEARKYIELAQNN